MKPPQYYIDNEEFLAAMKAYRAACQLAQEKNEERPRVPEYIGECFLKIATRLSHKANFASYTYREDMISDGVENCLVYIDNFDPDKTSNPFGYFTQVIFYAFIRRIQKEKRHTYIRFKVIEQAVINGDVAPSLGNDVLHFDNVQEFIRKFDTYTTERRARRAQAKETV